MKDTIANLTSLNALLLEGFGERSEKLEEMADALTMDHRKESVNHDKIKYSHKRRLESIRPGD